MSERYQRAFAVPEDFPALLKTFTREILRAQPENLYEFGARYFAELVEVRLARTRRCRPCAARPHLSARPCAAPGRWRRGSDGMSMAARAARVAKGGVCAARGACFRRA